MSTTNAQAALAAAAQVAVVFVDSKGYTSPIDGASSSVLMKAETFKKWLDDWDRVEAERATVATKGTLDERVALLESEIFA